MGNTINRGLTAKLAGLFLLVSVIPGIVIGTQSLYTSRISLEKTTLEKLSSATEMRKREINVDLKRAVEETRQLQQSARDLEGLGKILSDLVGHYKV